MLGAIAGGVGGSTLTDWNWRARREPAKGGLSQSSPGCAASITGKEGRHRLYLVPVGDAGTVGADEASIWSAATRRWNSSISIGIPSAGRGTVRV